MRSKRFDLISETHPCIRMPPKKAGGGKKTAAGYSMPVPMPLGTVLTDMTKTQWVIGGAVGKGGFGELYTVKEQVTIVSVVQGDLLLQGGKGPECVVKIEPHENGPLFVEMHYYLRLYLTTS